MKHTHKLTAMSSTSHLMNYECKKSIEEAISGRSGRVIAQCLKKKDAAWIGLLLPYLSILHLYAKVCQGCFSQGLNIVYCLSWLRGNETMERLHVHIFRDLDNVKCTRSVKWEKMDPKGAWDLKKFKRLNQVTLYFSIDSGLGVDFNGVVEVEVEVEVASKSTFKIRQTHLLKLGSSSTAGEEDQEVALVKDGRRKILSCRRLCWSG
ncbi:hypothetical protein BJ878DRAFT_214343 [Calycina marina]|uniref:Uncharacterized protein n=1 Tax=Calycina marina TaxID=1763456 RepID=A0A9P8CCJ3_9HELO|nr:hypothetical protein BJ878DRAFT_214343 [Calycina marina]